MSATLTEDVQSLKKLILHNPVKLLQLLPFIHVCTCAQIHVTVHIIFGNEKVVAASMVLFCIEVSFSPRYLSSV